jgi:A/G-specific adenine glycosylase
MQEIIKPKNFNKDLNIKISNMNMNIKIEYDKTTRLVKAPNWIDPKNLHNYTLPSFTKKIVNYLENHK